MVTFVGSGSDQAAGGTALKGVTSAVATLPSLAANDIIIVSVNCYRGSGAPTVTGYGLQFSDSTNGHSSDSQYVYTKQAAGSETSVTVTFGSNQWGTILTYVLRGLSSATPAHTANSIGTTAFGTPALTIGSSGNATVYGYSTTLTGNSGAVSFTATPASLSNWADESQTSDGDCQGIGWGINISSPGTATASVTTSSTIDWAFDFAPSTTTRNGAVVTSATAHSSFGGTKTTFRGLTASASATSSFAPTQPRHGALVSSATAILTAAGKKTGFAALSVAATANSIFAGLRTALPHFTAAISAQFTIAAKKYVADTRTPLNLGGSETTVPKGGTTVVNGSFGGAISSVNLGGTITMVNLGGGAVGWTMQNVNLNFAEFNDITLSVSITSNGVALNLTGYTVNMYLKPSAGIVDTDARNKKLSSGGGSPAITITSPSGGLCTIAVPDTILQDQSLSFYRIDADDPSGNINTAIYGNITYTAL